MVHLTNKDARISNTVKLHVVLIINKFFTFIDAFNCESRETGFETNLLYLKERVHIFSPTFYRTFGYKLKLIRELCSL